MKTYRQVISFLKRGLGPEYPVSVRRLRLSEHLDGDCQFKNDKFYIRINRNLPEHEAIETALHEIAHVISWNHESNDHGPKWGIAYSKVYRLFEKEFLERN